ncbi:MAG: cupin domain-containing protein [Bacillota bacterium]
MIVDPAKVQSQQVLGDGAVGLVYRTILGPAPGRRLTSNLVEVSPGGITRKHRHQWEQVNYILSGDGVLVTGEGSRSRVAGGMIAHIPGGEMHWFENTGQVPLVILGVLGPDAQ